MGRGLSGGGGVTPSAPIPFYDRLLKDDVNSFSSTSDIFFMLGIYLISAEELTKHKHTIQRCSQISDI
jgi:hypothetical protein